MDQTIDDFFIKPISELESTIKKFEFIHSDLTVDSEEVLSFDPELRFPHKSQISFVIFDETKIDMIYLFQQCGECKNIDENWTAYNVDEVDYWVYDGVDHFLIFFPEREKLDFLALWESTFN